MAINIANIAGQAIGGALGAAVSFLGGGSQLGAFGPVVFQTSQWLVRTWESLRRNAEVKFTDHEVILQKPVSEFTGADLDSIEFTIVLNGELGIDPLAEAEVLRGIMTSGEPQQLQLAGTSFGKFTLRKVEEEWRHMRGGRPLIIGLNIEIKEYIDAVPSQAMSKAREDELRQPETGAGGPQRLAGAPSQTQPRATQPMRIDPVTRLVIGGDSGGAGGDDDMGGDFDYDL